MAKPRTGIWLIGARGGVATTTILGLLALRKGLVDSTGLVSVLPQFHGLGLVDWSEIAVGGHEIRTGTLWDSASQLVETSRAVDQQLAQACRCDLAKIDDSICLGTLINVGSTIKSLADATARRRSESPEAAVRRLQQDLDDFVSRHSLERLVVVNLASTEPSTSAAAIPKRWDDLARTLSQPRNCPLTASSLYAIAALDRGYPYINFTPSIGSSPPAIRELALERDTCHMGYDGKTGETLLKSVLAPMFAQRHLEVLSWVGHNIFGNLDGKVLDNPQNKEAKVSSKDNVLGKVLGYNPQTLVSIEYIRSLGDWKTAWDHIHFRGFLGTPMVMQFVWQGCDSLLAAPLVLDLARFTLRAQENGDRGELTFLSSFFKTPLGTEEHNFAKQFQMLEQWAGSVEQGRPERNGD